MAQSHFIGSVPENYQRYLVPALFQPYARTMAARVAGLGPSSVLELACGTGALTRSLSAVLPADARLVATDLSEDMLNVARGNLGDDSRIEWRIADACSLPFEDASFGVIVCQFGVMTFPDKPAATAEAFRVLSPGGHLVYSVWGELSSNPAFHTVEDTLTAMFPEEEKPFMPTPFSMCDLAVHHRLLDQAGFAQITVWAEQLWVGPFTPASLAAGFALGTPLGLYLGGRGYDLGEVQSRLAAAFEAKSKDPSFSGMRAIVCHAIKA